MYIWYSMSLCDAGWYLADTWRMPAGWVLCYNEIAGCRPVTNILTLCGAIIFRSVLEIMAKKHDWKTRFTIHAKIVTSMAPSWLMIISRSRHARKPTCGLTVPLVNLGGLGPWKVHFPDSKGVFPKIAVPQNGWFYHGKPYYKWMIWGYHYFRKHPYKTRPILRRFLEIRIRFCFYLKIRSILPDFGVQKVPTCSCSRLEPISKLFLGYRSIYPMI